MFRGTKGMRQLIDDLLVIATTPLQDFLSGKVQAYFKAAFEDLWRCMEPKVKALVSKNSSYRSDLGYSCLSVLSECMACLLQYRST